MQHVNVVFHFPCKDGFTAAWAYYLYAKGQPKQVTQFWPESHNNGTYKALNEILERPTLSSEDVLLFDICPNNVDLLLAIHAKAKSLMVYDHHKSAQELCGHLPFCFFDMERSGAGIAWDVLHKTARPKLVDYVEDADLWRHKIPDADKYLIVLDTKRFTFTAWDDFHRDLQNPETNKAILEKGRHYVEYRSNVSRMLLGRKVHKLTFTRPEEPITLPAVNASIFQSGLGHMITNKPGPAAAVYYTSGNGWMFSLRSNDKGPDVSKLAGYYGGGGHRNAAGMKIPTLEHLTISEYTPEELAVIEAELGLDVDTCDLPLLIT